MDPIRDGNMKTVSYACSYVPEEIVLGAGMTPRRIIPQARPTEADAYIHPNTCYYIKSLLAEGLNGDVSSSDVFVIANSCDGMRRLHDLWKEYVEATPALFIDVPKKKDADSIEFFASELRRLVDKLEADFGGAQVTDERLNDAIVACNEVRTLMGEVHALQKDGRSSVGGRSVFDLCLQSAEVHPVDFADKLREFIFEASTTIGADEERKVILAGNMMCRPDLVDMIEDAGGRVVATDTCLGVRHFGGLVEENASDPLRALAERYLVEVSCPRMEGIDERTRRLQQLASDCAADAVIYSTVKFCDLHLYDVPYMQDAFKQAKMPFLYLENDYEWSGLGQMKTRVEAFLAMTGERGETSNV
jgi:benzoyl-CoA reductase/2-hydroxyglutaryl-CoA dehydratase subunit BcrC/BadD/HgdB